MQNVFIQRVTSRTSSRWQVSVGKAKAFFDSEAEAIIYATKLQDRVSASHDLPLFQERGDSTGDSMTP